ncbi:Hypothetical predicted protein, partial [Paramuricea clavata]
YCSHLKSGTYLKFNSCLFTFACSLISDTTNFKARPNHNRTICRLSANTR